MAYFDLKRTGLQYMFNLRGPNHETVLTSERYTSKQGALNGISSVRGHAPHDMFYRRLSTSTGYPYFNLKAVNGENIGTSEAYSSQANRELGIGWVKANAPMAPLRDNT